MDYIRIAVGGLGKLLFAQFTELMIEHYSNSLPGNLSLGPDLSADYGFKGVDIAMAAYRSELQYLANPETTHVHSAKQHNQDINSPALISARKTEEALDILKLVLASHLAALCQAIDFRQLEQALVETVTYFISTLTEELGFPDETREKLVNVARAVPVYTYLESPCNPSLPLFSALKQSCFDSILCSHQTNDGESNGTLVYKMKEFESYLGEQLEGAMTAVRVEYEQRRRVSYMSNPIKYYKFLPFYKFVRDDLKTSMMSARTEQTPQECLQKVFDAIADSRITKPLLECLRGLPA